MSSRLFKIAEKPAGDLATWKCPASSTTPALKVIDLGQEIKYLLRQGKITVHSVMSIWTGSPFAAVEAFKMLETEPNEIETKFSMAIFDIIDMLQNLMREDTLAFWNDGPKDTALKNLVPLAQDTAQLNRKLERITSTLENYAGELQRAAEFFERSFMKNDEDDNGTGDDELTRTTTKPLKSGNCFKIRRAVRKAWFALSRGDRKQIEDGGQEYEEIDDNKGHEDEEEEAKLIQEENVQELTQPEEPEQSSNTTEKNEMVHFRPERNKSDSVRCVNACNFNFGGGGGGHCGQQFYPYQRRVRMVPPPFTIQQMEEEREQQQKQQEENKPHCCCQQNNCQECTHHHDEIGDVPGQQEDMMTDVPKKSQQEVNLMESQPFEVSQFAKENNNCSYLQEYEQVTHHLRPEIDLNSQLILTLNPNNGGPSSGQEVTRTLGSHNKCPGQVLTDEPKLFMINETANNNNNELTMEKRSDNNNNFNDNGHHHHHLLDDIDSYSKEVVVVRSAVSNFAESEYGPLDSEDMEWLDKIQATGQTGHICADEIEQAEKLKRRSMFLNCIKFRIDEIHKDVTTVLNTLRQVESKWVDPLMRKKGQKNLQQQEDEDEKFGNLGLFELSQLVNILSQFCHDLVGHHHHHHHHNNNNKQLGGDQQEDGDRETILEDLMTVANETMTCHKSFKRFSKMIKADTIFLKDLCLSFPPIDHHQQQEEEPPEENEGQGQGPPPPNLPRPPASRPCNFQEIFC